ncbi:antitoxin Xre-like helix-turn-helix domain-containing protein [Castellaniella sp.]|uniref:antitoxin Xre-like helix-turn-helix domain-containing protein n=1 Tax=Castellaniella sp. TaxID=1955812 RepID=UPI003A9254C4
MRLDSIDEYMSLESAGIVEVVREGVPALAIDSLARAMGVPRAQLMAWMGWSVASVERKIRARATLSKSAGGQVLSTIRLISQVQRMVHESGNSEGFDAAIWLANWLKESSPALGCVPPGEYMDTAEGFNLLSDTLARMQSGAYV